jgi:hypothetical protein
MKLFNRYTPIFADHRTRFMAGILSGNAFQVAFTFLVSGFLAGAFFNLLTHSSALKEFFFIPYSARQASFSWFVLSSSILALGLVAGFLVS